MKGKLGGLLKKGAAAEGANISSGAGGIQWRNVVEDARSQQEKLIDEAREAPDGLARLMFHLKRGSGGAAERCMLCTEPLMSGFWLSSVHLLRSPV